MAVVEASGRAKVLVLVYSHLASDSRVLRQVRSLSASFEVTSAAFGQSPIEGVEHIELPDLPPYRGRFFGRIAYIAAFLLRRYSSLTRRNARDRAAATLLSGRTWDVVLANDVGTLPLARLLPARAGILADVHEYPTRQNEHSRSWRWIMAPYFRWLVTSQLTAAAAVTTVSGGLAREYFREFGIRADVVTNASTFQDLHPTAVAAPIRLVHSGAPAVQRRLEIMIDAVLLTSANVTLDFYLLEDGSDYLAGLKERAVQDDRIRFLPPVGSSELVGVLSRYDVGLCILPPTTFNLAWCLPNKFFDYVQARLGVIVGPSPEMQGVVEETGVGVVADDFTADALVRVIDELDPARISRWKAAAHAHATELSSGPQTEIWADLIVRLTAEL